jgi:hypothetical protein
MVDCRVDHIERPAAGKICKKREAAPILLLTVRGPEQRLLRLGCISSV